MDCISAKKIWTSGGWINNAAVHIKNGRIYRIDEGIDESECSVPLLIPGMIELHVHGSFGYNSASPDEKKNEEWLRRLAKHGVTGVLPTLSSHPAEEICNAVAFYDGVRKNAISGGAKVFGVHLEGPFVNMEKKGGINPLYIRTPSVEHFCELVGEHIDAVKVITVAPELDNADDLIKYLKNHGVRVNAGHSNATAEEMRRAISCGLDGVTHFFNATRPIAHRDPGLLTAALLDDSVFCEMVSDMVHLAPEIVCLLVRAAGASRVAVITDAVTWTGLPDGKYGDRVVINGSPQLENGTLSGGRYLMDDCARALIDIGIDPFDVFRMTSNTPAKRIGMTDVGDIVPSYSADLVAMDEKYNPLFTVVDGKKVI